MNLEAKQRTARNKKNKEQKDLEDLAAKRKKRGDGLTKEADDFQTTTEKSRKMSEAQRRPEI